MVGYWRAANDPKQTLRLVSRFEIELDHMIMNDNRIPRLGNYLSAAALIKLLVVAGRPVPEFLLV